jgi:hypothetical protein
MKYILIHTHHGSPYDVLVEYFSKVPGVWAGETGKNYKQVKDLTDLQNMDKRAIKFVDVILENKQIQSPVIEKLTLNIFLMGNEVGSQDYLRFRLRRMYEIWRRNGGIVLGPTIDEWAKIENLYDRKIDKVELKNSEIIDKYLSKFLLHM